MIQSRIASLINSIKDYVTYHGRLVLGATVLLCLVAYLGWKHSVWDQVESLESPITIAKEEYKNQGSTDHGASKKKGTHRDNKEMSKAEEKGKLLLGVRQVERPYPLQDMFQYDAGGMALPHNPSQEQTSDGKEKHQDSHSMETPQRRYRHRAQTGDVSLSHAVSPVKYHQVVRLGVIRGARTYVIVAIDGATYSLGLGETIDGIRIVAVDGDRVCVEEHGERRWIG